MDMPPDFDRLSSVRHDGRRSARREIAVWLLGTALISTLLVLLVSVLLVPGFATIDGAGAAFGP